MAWLPVSKIEVGLKPPNGWDELRVVEAPECNTQLALELAARLAVFPPGLSLDWGQLPVTDLDALFLHLRRQLFSETVLTDLSCPYPECSKRIDVSFSISDYLSYPQHRPRPVKDLEQADEEGWYRLGSSQKILFRLPNGADQVAITTALRPEQELVKRCIRPPNSPARWLKKVERAMEMLAPHLSHSLEGYCAECGRVVNIFFDVQRFCLQEIREQARFIHYEVHLLALHYHWPEDKILDLPGTRRRLYAELVAEERNHR